MKKIFSCVDIGSDSIKIIVSEDYDGKINILASVKYPSSGVKKGVIVDDNVVYEDLKNAFKEISDSLGVKIDKVITNVPIYDAVYEIVEGEITITNNHVISGEDMVNALQTAIYNKINKAFELVTITPIRYIIDGNEKVHIKEPRGLTAEKLKVYAMMITVPKKNIYKTVMILEKLGIEVIDILFNSLGDYTELKNKEFDNESIGVINIGSDKTEITTFNRGIITNSTILQLASKDIDDDISYVYNIKQKQAKTIKEIFALGHKDYASQSEITELVNKSSIKTKLNQYEVSEVVMNRLKEILEKSKKELNNLTKKEIRYIIVTGGITNIPGFDVLAKEVLGEKYIDKKVNTIGVRDNCYSSTLGMIKFFINKLKIRGKEYSMFNEDKEVELIDIKKSGNSGTLFDKMFDYISHGREE